MILLTITLKLRMILQNISRGVVGNVLINVSPSNIFLTLLLPAIFHQNCKAAVCINGLSPGPLVGYGGERITVRTTFK